VRNVSVKHVVVLAVAGALASLGTSALAVGQDSRSRATGRTEATAPDATARQNAEAERVRAESEEREESAGEKVKVFRFSGFDISGRLKSPQLLYFLNRLRAEFDRPRLPHRSFLPELDRSAKGRAF